MTGPPEREPARQEEPPPLLGSWRALYAAVLGTLALLIVLFYLFGKAFR